MELTVEKVTSLLDIREVELPAYERKLKKNNSR